MLSYKFIFHMVFKVLVVVSRYTKAQTVNHTADYEVPVHVSCSSYRVQTRESTCAKYILWYTTIM